MKVTKIYSHTFLTKLSWNQWFYYLNKLLEFFFQGEKLVRDFYFFFHAFEHWTTSVWKKNSSNHLFSKYVAFTKFCQTCYGKIIRQINSLVNTLLSRNFAKKVLPLTCLFLWFVAQPTILFISESHHKISHFHEIFLSKLWS